MKKLILKKQKKLSTKLSIIFFSISVFFFLCTVLVYIIVHSFNTGYDSGITVCKQAINNYMNVSYSFVYVPDKDLFNETYNGLVVFSDINDFSRINNIMLKNKINLLTYSKLQAIIYYQNQSKYNGYYEHIEVSACDGNYDPINKIVNLYRCDGDFKLRNINVSSKDSESFILLHELGHYMDYNSPEYQQDTADKYAIDNLKR